MALPRAARLSLSRSTSATRCQLKYHKKRLSSRLSKFSQFCSSSKILKPFLKTYFEEKSFSFSLSHSFEWERKESKKYLARKEENGILGDDMNAHFVSLLKSYHVKPFHFNLLLWWNLDSEQRRKRTRIQVASPIKPGETCTCNRNGTCNCKSKSLQFWCFSQARSHLILT